MDALSTALPTDLQALRDNFTVREGDREHFYRCWRNAECHKCLSEPQCGWCPLTWACVPNSYPIPLLAPAYDEGICPYREERWEMRTRPLGCQVSTVTGLTGVISIASTLVFLLLAVAAVFACRRAWRWGKAGRHRWNRFRSSRSGEAEPLLPDEGRLGAADGENALASSG
ncbi:hypothetical protein VD0004_g3508 [Verticillium dahliae]|uniref:PSI domain-containing protein n=1 Tax=Verticillium dahliae TaxID=27337 RepID=A0A444S3V2_VERDA|nr:hypothetical protein VD0004_g3508 [Verticillium dahliae]PNH74107.1 hypothetical protein VD0001_g3451 [Verticillium dahliae]RXG48068.1 hypothetical protein VDGE_04512 [Verticillium dahliae]